MYQMRDMRRDDMVSKSMSSTSNLSQAKSKLYTRMVDKLSEKFGHNQSDLIKKSLDYNLEGKPYINATLLQGIEDDIKRRMKEGGSGKLNKNSSFQNI
jgi:hypothetical protein